MQKSESNIGNSNTSQIKDMMSRSSIGNRQPNVLGVAIGSTVVFFLLYSLLMFIIYGFVLYPVMNNYYGQDILQLLSNGEDNNQAYNLLYEFLLTPLGLVILFSPIFIGSIVVGFFISTLVEARYLTTLLTSSITAGILLIPVIAGGDGMQGLWISIGIVAANLVPAFAGAATGGYWVTKKANKPFSGLVEVEGQKNSFRLSTINKIYLFICLGITFMKVILGPEEIAIKIGVLLAHLVVITVIPLLISWVVWRLIGKVSIGANMTFIMALTLTLFLVYW